VAAETAALSAICEEIAAATLAADAPIVDAAGALANQPRPGAAGHAGIAQRLPAAADKSADGAVDTRAGLGELRRAVGLGGPAGADPIEVGCRRRDREDCNRQDCQEPEK